MAQKRYAKNDVYEQRSDHIDLGIGSSEIYCNLQIEDMVDDDIYDKVKPQTRKETREKTSKRTPEKTPKKTLLANARTEKAESELSIRIVVAIAAVCVLVLSAVVSTIVIVIYHNAVVSTENSGNTAQQIQELRNQLNNSTLQLDKLRETSSRQLDMLENAQASTNNQVEKLEKSQTNASISLATLEEGQADTNKQLEIVAEKLNSSGQHVAFSVYALRPDLNANRAALFYYFTENTGSYKMSTGQFTCPVAGLYYFSLSLEHDSTSSGSAYCYFRVNGSRNVYVAARQSPYEVASGSVIQHLSVNDVVSLYCGGWQFVHTGLNTAVFSGFLISED